MIFTFVNNVNLLIFIECFCYGQFIAFYFERRKNYLLRVILSFLVFATLTYFIPLVRIENYFVDYLYCIFMYLSILFFTYLTILACVKITWFNGLFFAATSYLLHHSISATISLTLDAIFGEGVTLYNNYLYLIVYILVHLTLFTIFALVFKKNHLYSIFKNPPKTLMITSFVVLVDIILSSLTVVIGNADLKFHSMISKIYSIISSLLVLFIIFILLKQEKTEKEGEIIQTLYSQNIKHYEISKSTMATYHDLKHRLNALLNGKLNLQEKDIKDISDSVFMFENQFKTENEALNVLLTENGNICYRNHIEFNTMVDASRLSFLDIYDLYSLVGNALSNAIEATCKVEDGKAKYITFIVKGTEKYTSIHIENPFVGQVIMEHNLPVTNKQDKSSHGFGVKSMKNIVSKYDGKVTLTVKDNIFNVDILFNR